MTINKSQRLYQILLALTVILSGLIFISLSHIGPAMTEEEAREVAFWSIVLIISALALAVNLIYLGYIKRKLKNRIGEERELLESISQD